jgi:hypothetical protein
MRHDYNELLEEVSQQHMKERLLDFWNNFGNWILAVVAAVLVGAGGFNIYQYAQHQKQEQISNLFEKGRDALANNQEDEGKRILEDIAGRNVPGYRAMARMALADFYMKNKRPEPAYKQFKALEQDMFVEPIYRGIGALNRIRIDYENKVDPKKLIAEIDSLVSQNQSIRLMALELKGFLLMQIKENIKARDVFVELAQSPQVDASTRKRLHAMIRLIMLAS